MIDLVWILISGFVGLLGGALIIKVFKWGHDKEHNTKEK